MNVLSKFIYDLNQKWSSIPTTLWFNSQKFLLNGPWLMMENTHLTSQFNPNNPGIIETGHKENTIKDNIPGMKDPTKIKCQIQSMDGTEVQEMSSMGPLETMMKKTTKDSATNMEIEKAILVNALENSWMEWREADLLIWSFLSFSASFPFSWLRNASKSAKTEWEEDTLNWLPIQ